MHHVFLLALHDMRRNPLRVTKTAEHLKMQFMLYQPCQPADVPLSAGSHFTWHDVMPAGSTIQHEE